MRISADRNVRRPAWLLALGMVVPASIALLPPLRELRAAEKSPNPAARRDFFESKVRPLLVENCQGCHGAEKQKAGLRVDGLESLLTGGDSGPAIVPGRPEESLIVQAIGYNGDLKMPPKSKLAAEKLVAVTQWIADGAVWPDSEPGAAQAVEAKSAADSGFTAEQKRFWAFQPPRDRQAPAVKRAEWVRSPIDAFILAKLEAAGLAPAPPADRRTLIRRATYDLIGLPPTPEETAAFVNDPRPEAFEAVVERLLASPHYGERWGRHWLDVARYADSNGMDENLSFGNAWRYRDYVVRSFNADRPYNRFMAEQIAGDLLNEVDPEAADALKFDRLTATGFLVVGPKMLAEDDPVKMEMDVVDEQIDTIGRTLMGLTIGCARCHDHKFDPVSSADYYGFAGIFKSTKTMENFKVVARWNERPLCSPAEQARKESLEKRAAEVRAEIAKVVQEADAAVRAAHAATPGAAPLPAKIEHLFPPAVRDRLQALRADRTQAALDALQIPYAMAVADREPVDLKIHIRGNHLTLGAVAPRRFPAIFDGLDRSRTESESEAEAFGPSESGRRQFAEWLGSPDHPLTSRVMVNRIWHWHFGAGLVRTPDNFGALGERPTHPELLDRLALEFVRSGWSVKRMHRLIMRSSTYQMSTRYDERAAAADPENRLAWRMNRRRLDAESIRDSILAVSGRLDRRFGGNLLQVPNRKYVAGTASVNGATYDTARRSVYLPIIRSALYEVLQAFDFADPSTLNGRRETTTVAPQALCLMNSGLAAESSKALADRVLADPDRDDAGRAARIYSLAYGRAPTAAETARALSFIERYQQTAELRSTTPADRRRKAWQGFCRAVFESSEFIYVE